MAVGRRTQDTALRVPPQSLESEKALLGALMIRPEGMIDTTDVLSPDAFYSEKHRIIYNAMMTLYGKNEPIDIESVRACLADNKQVDAIGGVSYLAELVSNVPAASNAQFYGNQVQKKFMLRQLIDAGEYIAEIGFDEGEDLEETLDKAEKKIYEVTETPTLTKFTSIRETLHDAWARLEHLHQNKDALRGIRTGFKALDIARNAAVQNNVTVGVFSLEMSAQQLVDRMVSAEAKVNSWSLRTGNITEQGDFDRIKDAYERLSNAPIFIDDQPGNNILKMRSVARRLKKENGLGLIVVDYLQLMSPTQSKNSDNVVQQVTEISRSLKNLARELDVPVLALSQLSRAVEQRRGKPRLSDLRDSGSIEQDADVVMFIHRDDKMNETSDRPNIAEIMIEKHRNGPVGSIELFFDDKRTSFVSLEKSDFGGFDNTAAKADDFNTF
jgi:replicative DNA helicase